MAEQEMTWTDEDTGKLRVEIEQRFAARTPATRIDEVDLGARVSRGEMRMWCLAVLGKEMPEMDRDWALEHIRWQRCMMMRVISAKQPDDLPRLKALYKGAMKLPKE